MTKSQVYLIASILLSGFVVGCLALTPTASNQVSDAYIETAVASTLAVERAREAGAELSFTPTPEGTPADGEGTPAAEVEAGDGQEDDAGDPEPTLENPWMLQSYCVDNPDRCVYYGINNRTDSWLQIELKETDTGVTGFFSVRSKTYAEITLIPGLYKVKYTWWCEGEPASLVENKSLGSWIDVFKCPQGFYEKQIKQ